jgi:pyruvate dehydrogenase E2 component (dihydrolipoamide acetyltransferase)
MSEFRMPSLGADMEAGTLVEWLKQPGDRVGRGDIVAVVETQKGAIEIEIFEEGVIDELLVGPGTTVPVGTPLARLSGGAPAAPRAAVAEPPSAAQAPRAEAAKTPPVAVAPPAQPPGGGEHVTASPAARRLAMECGVDLATVKGTGPGGAVVSEDVECVKPVDLPPEERPVARRGLDLAAMRVAISAAMARSKREIPHYYLGTTIDMRRAQAWLAEVNAARPPTERLLYGVLLLKAVALALRKSPELNGFYIDGAFRPSDAIHVGMAVAIRGGGLVAPAIHDTAERSVDELMAILRDLVARVRAGTLRSSEIADPTITVTSLGERGVESIQPVIYPPQVAIVGFGKLVERPWAVDGALAVHPVIQASLAADHRVSDGHRGALFLSEIDSLLQEPAKL